MGICVQGETLSHWIGQYQEIKSGDKFKIARVKLRLKKQFTLLPTITTMTNTGNRPRLSRFT